MFAIFISRNGCLSLLLRGAMFAIFISRNGCLSLLLKHLTAFVFPSLSKNCCASVCKDCSALFLVSSLLSVWNQDRTGTECPCRS